MSSSGQEPEGSCLVAQPNHPSPHLDTPRHVESRLCGLLGASRRMISETGSARCRSHNQVGRRTSAFVTAAPRSVSLAGMASSMLWLGE